jgi:Ser/Thr protein kinase RdoA (MazF antagonist)
MVSLEDARRIAERFQIERPFGISLFEGRGNINLDTLLVTAGSEGRGYLLQNVNRHVFPMADRVMAGMVASIEAQNASKTGGLDWHVPDLVPTLEGDLYLARDGGAWRMMRYIEGTVSFKSLAEVPSERRLGTAEEVGRGLAIYSDLTACIDATTLRPALPGYRNTRMYYKQLDAALRECDRLDAAADLLPSDPEERETCQRHFYSELSEEERRRRRQDPGLQPFIETALRHRALAESLQEARERGDLRTTAIHGDTKIENFLFDAATGKVAALVDLDTIMPLTWLADWGDMVRSLCNVAGEKETDLSKVQVDRDVYRAVSAGFLRAATTATPLEIHLMPTAVQAIALELGVRFLSDYLRGDTYFLLAPGDPPDLNRTRAMVQIALFQRLLEHEPEARSLLP